ncbi:MAG: GrpB family protein [Catenulispora sp.]|nr:GrpB family protein [Catenulispora sp.]
MDDSTATARTVEVVAYDPAWPKQFAVEQSLLAQALPDALAIEHIGSTSVPGLCAKPTIDVLVVVADVNLVLDRTAALTRLGYEHRPGSFAEDPEHLFFRKVENGKRTHHLHVLEAGSPVPEQYRLFRDFLIADGEAAARYGRAKQDLARRYATERARYVAEKPQVVDALIAQARRWRTATQRD